MDFKKWHNKLCFDPDFRGRQDVLQDFAREQEVTEGG